MKTVDKKYQVHYYSPYNQVAMQVNSGESVVFQCMDTYNDRLPDETSSVGRDMAGFALNPLNGPVYVKEALPGDTMKITIEDVRVGSSHATMVVNDNLVLKGFAPYVCEEQVIKIPIEGDEADIFGNKVKLRPFPGCLGLAPTEKISTMFPGRFGGNMDCKVLTKGSVFYVPVQVEGGLVVAGDIHAYQGDGEIVCGLEVSGEIQLKLEVVKGREEMWPVIETEDMWYTVASCSTMEEAGHKAVQGMMEFFVRGQNDILIMKS
ncbi:acetamidase/formamidase family protein [Clostridium sp. AM58-1XD]|uniref:acetamidase/formamidase family protein n=1 Tax=Clostridium sp. AM58-1XD TaxID=2292307 RepID=UPI001FA88D9B|nr:acetamidase/formamidase family protein [Clostridium sp. AM58-1XD]